MLLGREFHNKEGKGLKEGENIADAKGPRLDSPVTDGEKNSSLQIIAEGSSKVVPTPVEYTTSEIIDGKPVNTVEGLKVYEGLVNVTEINKIVSLVNETKASSRRGGFEVGQTVIVGKRPLKGHGSVIIQLGVPIIEGPLEDENQRETTRVEPVPGLLHDLFDRFFRQGIVPSKPDYCVVDFYYEEEYSHPQQPPSWYGRPLCTLCLTECDMVFGRVIFGERGDNRGPLKFSLSTGSLVVLQGRSADVAKRAIPATLLLQGAQEQQEGPIQPRQNQSAMGALVLRVRSSRTVVRRMLGSARLSQVPLNRRKEVMVAGNSHILDKRKYLDAVELS
ncbi:unnamed protein product [Triticum turgidum subsp. durum]|uniref:Uncharacterized protein n=1 Tax=Triticum turgidum subsp. durum TaxID=4567 RepID=A0A9R0S4L7_TRITD|nr:unnamed protein product [Triticum turgidum subsp. durum]